MASLNSVHENLALGERVGMISIHENGLSTSYVHLPGPQVDFSQYLMQAVFRELLEQNPDFLNDVPNVSYTPGVQAHNLMISSFSLAIFFTATACLYPLRISNTSSARLLCVRACLLHISSCTAMFRDRFVNSLEIGSESTFREHDPAFITPLVRISDTIRDLQAA